MNYNHCIKCGNDEYIVQSTTFVIKDETESFFHKQKNELYYIKICTNCGFAELYNAKLVDKCVKRNPTSPI